MSKVKLGELLTIKHGYAFKSECYVDKSEYALVTLANISSRNDFQFDKSKTTYYGGTFSDEFILHEGDLILPLTEQVIGLFGNSAFVPSVSGHTFVLNQRVGKVIVKEDKADKYYIHYLLSTKSVREQLEHRASGTKQRNISPDDVYDVVVYVPDISAQQRIGKTLYGLEKKVKLNNLINDNLWQSISTIYDYWFTQFDFPDANGKPYHTTGGNLVWNDKIKRAIPRGWTVASIINNPLTEVIKPGVDVFTTKEYLATADVTGTSIASGSIIDYENREGRANMQPVVNSVWFAKMKNSIKHLFLNKEMAPIIDSTILSTGFCGLQCSEKSFEYVASFVSNPRFEIIKDILAHGATQEAVNNDDMESISFVIPSDEILEQYHAATKGMFAQISKNICENRELIKVRDWLLPMLMNGQATIAD